MRAACWPIELAGGGYCLVTTVGVGRSWAICFLTFLVAGGVVRLQLADISLNCPHNEMKLKRNSF